MHNYSIKSLNTVSLKTDQNEDESHEYVVIVVYNRARLVSITFHYVKSTRIK